MEWDEFAMEDHTYRFTSEEKKRYKGQWYLTLNKSGKNAPMRLPDFCNNIKDGILLPQAIPDGTGTRPKAGGAHEFNFFSRPTAAAGSVYS